MALRFFKDSGLSIPVTDVNPLWILAPLAGSVKRVSVWLGDDSSTLMARDAVMDAAEVALLDTTLLAPSGGYFAVDGALVQYAYKDTQYAYTMTGMPPAKANDTVYPVSTWSGAGSLYILPSGNDLGTNVTISLKRSDQTEYGIPGTPVLYSYPDTLSAAAAGPVPLAQVDLQIVTAAGTERNFSACQLITSFLTELASGDVRQAVLPISVNRATHGLAQRFRLYSQDRILVPDPAGFVVGSFRWRDETQINQTALLPWQWDPDTTTIGTEKFIPGVGNGNDLILTTLEKSTDPTALHAVYARI